MIDEKKLNTDDLCDICSSADCANCFSDEDFKKWIDRQPKVGEWIPVSERLPNDGQWVIVFAKSNVDNDWNVPSIVQYMGDGIWRWNTLIPISDDVIAWMPLPEPYKEQNDDI